MEKVTELHPVAEDDSLTLHINPPYVWEGKEYSSLDLSGLNKITAQDLIDADKVAQKSGTVQVVPAVGPEFACFIAARATDKPIEFFRLLPGRVAVRLQNLITGFFYGEA